MIGKKLTDEINEQIKLEMYSAYLYLSMSAHCESANLPGFASWLRIQAKEEMGHAMKFYDYMHERGGIVTLKAIDQPPHEFKSPLAMFESVYEHERSVTQRIEFLYALALEEKDYAAQVFLQWYLSEQVEEEKNATQIVESLKMAGDSHNAIFMLDHRVGKRGGEE
jgi:ferritin